MALRTRFPLLLISALVLGGLALGSVDANPPATEPPHDARAARAGLPEPGGVASLVGLGALAWMTRPSRNREALLAVLQSARRG